MTVAVHLRTLRWEDGVVEKAVRIYGSQELADEAIGGFDYVVARDPTQEAMNVPGTDVWARPVGDGQRFPEALLFYRFDAVIVHVVGII